MKIVGDIILKTLIDRHDTSKIKNLDRMVTELSKHMSEFEIDKCIDLINTMSQSQYDINLSVDDAAAQLRLTLGRDRYQYLKYLWSKSNQSLIKEGKTKFVHKETGDIFDGLDPDDDPAHYDRIMM